jgi:hypothetical protein
MNDYEFQFTAGVLVRKNVRILLESEVFSSGGIRWLEDKRWTFSTFRVRGVRAKQFEERLRHYLRSLGVSD